MSGAGQCDRFLGKLGLHVWGWPKESDFAGLTMEDASDDEGGGDFEDRWAEGISFPTIKSRDIHCTT